MAHYEPPRRIRIRAFHYSYIFNFFLNCNHIDERIYFLWTKGPYMVVRLDNMQRLIRFFRYRIERKYKIIGLHDVLLTDYFNCGHSRYKELHFFDYFRLLIILIYKYYDSYIYNLYRWSYVLKEKEYGLYYFFCKKLNNIKKR